VDYLQVLLLALLPAAGNFFGGIVAEIVPTSRRTLSRALHVAAGIVMAVVAVELMPEALEGAAPWLVVLGFCLGGACFIGLDAALERFGGGEEKAGPWLVYAAVFIDLFSDGLMIGVGSVVSFGLALVLAVGQVTADVPEGFAAIANFRDKGVARSKRILLSASFVTATLLGATVGYFLLRDQSRAIQLTALAFTAGLLILAAVEEMLGEAHDAADDSRLTAAFFIGGFALFTLVASYFEA
jgi:ZIP family zinc transporter